MTSMDKKYSADGLAICAFPSNQFLNQEPGTEEEIKEYVKRFDVRFYMFSKIDVNGDKTHPVYQFLKKSFPGDITWNFSTRWLVDHNGIPIRRFETESDNEVEAEVANAVQAAKAAREAAASAASVSSASN